jgi:hypothetical protein
MENPASSQQQQVRDLRGQIDLRFVTQYKAQSLIRHIQGGWSFLDGRLHKFIDLLPNLSGLFVSLEVCAGSWLVMSGHTLISPQQDST